MSKSNARTQTLSRVKLFTSCTGKELDEVGRITTEVRVRAGRVLCNEGAPGQECFVVVSGQACVTIAGEHVATIEDGGFFGEMALLDGGPRVATVTAETDMVLLALTSAEFSSLLDRVPAVTRHMLASVGARLRGADHKAHPSLVGI